MLPPVLAEDADTPAAAAAAAPLPLAAAAAAEDPAAAEAAAEPSDAAVAAAAPAQHTDTGHCARTRQTKHGPRTNRFWSRQICCCGFCEPEVANKIQKIPIQMKKMLNAITSHVKAYMQLQPNLRVFVYDNHDSNLL